MDRSDELRRPMERHLLGALKTSRPQGRATALTMLLPQREFHKTRDGMRPVNAALGSPAVAVVPDFLISLRMRKRHALSRKPPRMSRGRRGRSVDGSLHARTFGATPWKIWEMGTPTTTGLRNENRKIVLHDRPIQAQNAKSATM
jgi:hypothetical protein